LFALLDGFAQARVLVVGDLTLDEFLTGQVERISREAPVLILRHETTRQTPGGGANAVYNLAKLGAKVKVVGLVGKDIQGEVLQKIFESAGIDTSGILIDPDRPTVTKTRIAGHARQSVTQQIVRVDRKSDELPNSTQQLQLAEQIRQQLNLVDAVVCSDYGDGILTPPVMRQRYPTHEQLWMPKRVYGVTAELRYLPLTCRRRSRRWDMQLTILKVLQQQVLICYH
jgi:rfaE bifunctional protein kinase chain/domain